MDDGVFPLEVDGHLSHLMCSRGTQDSQLQHLDKAARHISLRGGTMLMVLVCCHVVVAVVVLVVMVVVVTVV